MLFTTLLCFTSYLIAKETGGKQTRREDYDVKLALIVIKAETTRFGSAKRVKEAITAALNGLAA